MPKNDTIRTHAVRVRIREVTYQVITADQLGNKYIDLKVGHGPENPEIEPTHLLGEEADHESQEYQEAAENYKLGELIHVMDDDYLRFTNHKCVIDQEQVEELLETETEYLDVADATVEDLTRWIQETNPTVQDVVNASENEPEYAQKLLEAEANAHDGEPRIGVQKGLMVVVSRS